MQKAELGMSFSAHSAEKFYLSARTEQAGEEALPAGVRLRGKLLEKKDRENDGREKKTSF